MADNQDTKQLPGPDFRTGVDFDSLTENLPLLGHVDNEAVILVRRGQQVFAIGATCTHYSGPLAEGLVVGDTIRCPWHHARFDFIPFSATATELRPAKSASLLLGCSSAARPPQLSLLVREPRVQPALT